MPSPFLRLAMLLAALGLSSSACESGTEYARPRDLGSPARDPVNPRSEGGAGGETSVEDSGVDDPGVEEPGDGDGDRSPVESPFSLGGGPATGPEIPDEGPPVCRQDSVWGGTILLDNVNTAAEEILLAVASDELSLIFERGGTAMITERESTEDPWGAGSALVLQPGIDTSLGVALAPDGLALVVVKEEGAGLVYFTRSARGDAFDLVDDHSMFTVLNSTAEMTVMTLSNPVFSDDGSELWWVEYWGESTIYRSPFDEDSTLTRSRLGCDERGACSLLLDGIDGERNVITGVSTDLRTVFMDFEETGAHMMFRDYVALKAPFLYDIPLLARESPQTNSDCSRLYYSEAGDLKVDVLQ